MYAEINVKIILVGNKCDLKEKQVVDASSAQVCGVLNSVPLREGVGGGDLVGQIPRGPRLALWL